jgi:hypothetical protein
MFSQHAQLPGTRPYNALILTAGLTGSSVVAGSLVQAGYWAGHDTARKPDYDTFENARLIALNSQLIAASGYPGQFDRRFDPDHLARAIDRLGRIDPTPYRDFIDSCNSHAPWVLKDPRFWLTVRAWRPLLNPDRLRIILVSREDGQSWISHTLRRQIQTPSYCRAYMQGIRNSLLAFIDEARVPHMEVVYEDMLRNPARVTRSLSRLLGVEITVAHVQAVYRGRLGRRQHGLPGMLRAGLIYAKNYPSRARLGGSDPAPL